VPPSVVGQIRGTSDARIDHNPSRSAAQRLRPIELWDVYFGLEKQGEDLFQCGASHLVGPMGVLQR